MVTINLDWPDLVINPRFQQLLAPLTTEEKAQLEESILANGCQSPIDVWHGQIIDGHNRHEICQAHSLHFEIRDRSNDFESEEDVVEWMYINQLGRRNLSQNQKVLYIGELFELRKKKRGGDRRSEDFEISKCHCDTLKNEAELTTSLEYEIDPEFQKKPHQTAANIAKEFGVSPRTVTRAAKVAKAIETLPEEVRESFIQGEITQKEVLSQVAPAESEQPSPEDPTRDAFTARAAETSKALHSHFTAIRTIIAHAKTQFYNDGQPFEHWCPQLSSLNLEIPLIDVKALKSLRICKFCKGEKCPICHETGYQTGTQFLMK